MSKILSHGQQEYLFSFLKKSDQLLEEMETYAQKNNVPILSKDSADFIEKLIVISNPERVLEIGTAIGYTTIRIARKLRKKSIIHTIEKSSDNIPVAAENISRSGVRKKIKIFEGEASEIMDGFKKKYDFIFLDADKQDYSKLFRQSMKLLKKGGVIFVDNLLWHGYAAAPKVPDNYKSSTKYIREFNNEFINYPGLEASILPIGDGIGLGIKMQKQKND